MVYITALLELSGCHKKKQCRGYSETRADNILKKLSMVDDVKRMFLRVVNRDLLSRVLVPTVVIDNNCLKRESLHNIFITVLLFY